MTLCDILWQRTALKRQVSIKAFDYTPPTSKWISWNLDLEAEIWSDVWKLTVLEGTVDTWLNLSSSWTFCIHANLIQPQLLKQWASTDEIYMRSQMEKEKENSGREATKGQVQELPEAIRTALLKHHKSIPWTEQSHIKIYSYHQACINLIAYSRNVEVLQLYFKKIPLFNK